MSIIEIFINNNLEKYIDDETFINKIYFLSKNKNFIKRRKSILLKKSNILLNDIFKDYEYIPVNDIREDVIKNHFKNKLLELSEHCFYKYDLIEKKNPKEYINYQKNVNSVINIISITHGIHMDLEDFNLNNNISFKPICYIYRVNSITKYMILKHFPYAKALIY